MAEGDPYLQEQVSAQEQGAEARVVDSSVLKQLVLNASGHNDRFPHEAIAAPPFQESATMGGGIPICRQAQTKLEVCLYMFLWSPDTEAVLVAMSCFRHLCEEADIRSAADEVPVQTILPNYATFSELASVSNMMGTGQFLQLLQRNKQDDSPILLDMLLFSSDALTNHFNPLGVCTGRSTLQKRVMALLRRIEHPTPGNIEVRVSLADIVRGPSF